jgi:hypothetical protein
VGKWHRVDVCTERHQLPSDNETFLSKVITGDLTPCIFFLLSKMKLKLKGRRFDTIEEIQAKLQRVLDTLTERTFRERSKNGGDGGTRVYMWEGTTSRVMAGNNPYSVSPEYFGYHLVFVLLHALFSFVIMST